MGKSQLTRELTRLLQEHNLSSLSSAVMAVAASNMTNTGTICSVYNFAVDRTKSKRRKEKNVFLNPISDDQMRLFRSRIQQGLNDSTPITTIIDEISMLSPIQLGQIMGRYDDHRLHDFRPGPFILVGDMWQARTFPFYKPIPFFFTFSCADSASWRDINLPNHDE